MDHIDHWQRISIIGTPRDAWAAKWTATPGWQAGGADPHDGCRSPTCPVQQVICIRHAHCAAERSRILENQMVAACGEPQCERC
jgi:hypothetical protein